MSATIRLARHGAKKKPIYRIVVADTRSPRDGRKIELVGFYDPNQNPPRVDFKKERLDQWLKRGARPTATVAQLMKKSGIGKPAAPAES